MLHRRQQTERPRFRKGQDLRRLAAIDRGGVSEAFVRSGDYPVALDAAGAADGR